MTESNIAPRQARANRRNVAGVGGIAALMATVTAVRPNCHTVELHFPTTLPPLDELRAVCRDQWLAYEDCESGWGHRLAINSVPRAAFPILDKIRRKHKATVCRFDIAYDFDALDREALQDHLVKNGVLLWNPSKRMCDYGAGVYFIDLTGRNGRQTPRCLVVYSDQPHKGCHLELRFLGTGSVKRQGVEEPSDILALNMRALLKRHFRLVEDVDADTTKFTHRLQREAVAEFRKTAKPRRTAEAAFWDLYQTRIQHRVAGLVRRLCPSGRAQEYHKVMKMPMVAVDLDVLQIPEGITFTDELF